MKKKIAALALGLAVLFGAVNIASAGDDKIISFAQLPKVAQSFVKKHYPKLQVSLVKLDKELFDQSYEVILSDGSRVEFDKKGNWTDIDGQDRPIPLTAIPASISAHVRKNFPGTKVVQIERTDRGRYSVELDNHIDLLFDKNFRFVGIDD